MKIFIINKKITIISILSMVIFFFSGASIHTPPTNNCNSKGYVPSEGFVPDKSTAIKIATAVWFPIYGERIYKKKPYKIKLLKGIWIVEGSMSKDVEGGVPYIEIQKKDGKILKVSHGK